MRDMIEKCGAWRVLKESHDIMDKLRMRYHNVLIGSRYVREVGVSRVL